MNRAMTPTRERARLDALRRYGVLDCEPEQRFDDIVMLASSVLEMPIAMISLVDKQREWSLAATGIERGELPRDDSPCVHAILDDEPLVIHDTVMDPRVSSSPLVTDEPHIRFYAGAPLITPSGYRVGALSVLDQIPRMLGERELAILTRLAAQVVELLEHRLTAARLVDALQRLQTMASLIPICSHCRKVRDGSNHWMSLERFVQATTGSRFTHGICPDCVREHYPDAADDLLSRGGQ